MPKPDDTPPLYCTAGKDCETKMALALAWVQDHCRWKLRIANDTVITTEGPMNTTDAAFQITKRPAPGAPDGQYLIDFRVGCGNMFGCVPSAGELHASFYRSVLNQ